MNTTRTVITTFVLALALLGIPASAQDAPSCEHHEAMAANLANIEKVIADAKTSRDVAALHAALNQIESQVAKMQASNRKCAGMMEMMQKMGRMKSNTPIAKGPHDHK